MVSIMMFKKLYKDKGTILCYTYDTNEKYSDLASTQAT